MEAEVLLVIALNRLESAVVEPDRSQFEKISLSLVCLAVPTVPLHNSRTLFWFDFVIQYIVPVLVVMIHYIYMICELVVPVLVIRMTVMIMMLILIHNLGTHGSC